MSEEEMFDSKSVEKDSPRLAWFKKHNVSTYRTPHMADEDEPWNCWSGPLQEAVNNNRYATGETEDEAIANWAIENEVRLWNEE